jgi:hypothetical protein
MPNSQLYQPQPTEPDSFNGYTRRLTDRGGYLIQYRDCIRSRLLGGIRFIVAVTCTIGGVWFLADSTLPILPRIVLFVVELVIVMLFARFPITQRHSAEVHPDGLIIDGKYFFPADEIGDNWPSLQMLDDDPDRLVLCGICGTRFIEYSTVNRVDENDRTPERLMQDLELAMEQLWGRREEIVPAAE